MRKTLLFLFLVPIIGLAQPKDEVRAVWLTTAFNLDFPKTFGVEKQKNELIELLDEFKKSNFNTVMIQVRARGDLIYPSSIEPWAKSLTNNLGQDPGYDPLRFVITEAHKRGIEIHAWWNVYKVYGKGTPIRTIPEHIATLHPEFCKTYKDEIWLDPGIPGVRNYLLNLACEMIRKYDIDGLHLDYVRYPDTGFDDSKTYNLFGKGENKADWRRDNVTKFVEAVYDSVQNIRPYVKVGVAPVGIYKKSTAGSGGWDAYNITYQDPVRWVRDGKVDYVSPQTYWSINSYPYFVNTNRQWEKLLTGNVQLFPGIAAYKLSKEYENWPADEILAQVDALRKLGVNGVVFFREENLFRNNKNILNLLKNTRFKYPANIPPMKWKDSTKPGSPIGLTTFKDSDTKFSFYWNDPKILSGNNIPNYYNFYIDNVSPVDITQAKNILKLRVPADKKSRLIDLSSFPDGKYFVCITSLDKGNNESEPSNEVLISIDRSGIPISITVAKNQK
ncbi:MAG TPA: family 10 glycosylhydrolase [Ignavibacteriaceae bacterium]|nr:family 10 glycosylhydrolase [Ignavibacteriaceae bacterium]